MTLSLIIIGVSAITILLTPVSKGDASFKKHFHFIVSVVFFILSAQFLESYFEFSAFLSIILTIFAFALLELMAKLMT